MNEERLTRLPELLDKYPSMTVNTDTGVIEGKKEFLKDRGWKYVKLYKNNKSYQYASHELVAYVGGLNLKNLTVNHINGDKTDNRLANLETLTALENHHKAKELGLFQVGEKVPSSKLTEDQVVWIKSNAKGDFGEGAEMSRKFGVDSATIGKILRGDSWRHVDIPVPEVYSRKDRKWY